MTKRDGYPFLCGVLLTMTDGLLKSIERCERHEHADPWTASRDRAELRRIRHVLDTQDWTENDIRAVLGEEVPANSPPVVTR